METRKKGIRVLIYTDSTRFFHLYLKKFEIEYIVLTTEMLEEMSGEARYIHRRKVNVIDLTFQRFPDEDLLFVDSDTFFIHEIDGLLTGFCTGKSFMHKREYNFEEGLSFFNSFNQGHYPQAFINYISDRSFMIGGVLEKFNKYDYSWNSGVLGLTRDFASYMPEVYELTDAFYANSQWFVSEQLAFSLILQKRTEIRPAEKFILHYWGSRQKKLMDKLINNLFDSKSVVELNDLSFLRSMTKKWKKKIEIDLVLEQAVISFSKGYMVNGIKKSLQVLLYFPSDYSVYKELFLTIHKNKIKV
ncbi:MAG: hypothetical protein P0Y49_08680 [Candidatus Pedobacter colombiensis]|uniref:Nucleotide-diphospho-sugar transferase domain-containing protein n=1 Tax=Candidatus Pedobacter colombiensis TaxID=3121371 RepID=A0AAJ5WBE0_9SPHI|nr:hypothetical protein [Pedobacter sp.]WEK21215.1 MAG: hypothetical protein P0Y49_08680 [Pedobacter sp.]